jgi:hypothetical protein
MASHMATSYEPQAPQVNEKPVAKSSLNLTLMQHPRYVDFTRRKTLIYNRCLRLFFSRKRHFTTNYLIVA